MIGNRIDIIRGTTALTFLVQIVDADGDPVDLTGASSITFSMRERGAAVRKVDDVAAFVANGTYTFPDGSTATYTPADGVLGYAPTDQDVDTAGLYDARWQATVNGKILKGPSADFLLIAIKADV